MDGNRLEADTPMVYVIEQQPFDYNPAAKFGTLFFMNNMKLAPTSPNDNNTWNDRLLRTIRKELADYQPGKDYVIPTGSPAKMLVAGMVLGSIGTVHRLLGWDARAQHYVEYVVNL